MAPTQVLRRRSRLYPSARLREYKASSWWYQLQQDFLPLPALPPHLPPVLPHRGRGLGGVRNWLASWKVAEGREKY